MTRPTVIAQISDLEDHVGVPLGTTDWMVVDQAMIDAFAEVTGDRQWIHTDVERAKLESPFKQTVAHGYLTLSLIPVLLPQLLVVEKVRMVVNYGFDKLRLPAPVPAGSRIRMSSEIKKVRRIPGGGARANLSITIEVEDQKKPACTADAVYAYFP
jgi:acyl dehydratase